TGTQKSPKLAFRAGKGCLCLLHTLPKIAKSVKLLFQHFETMPRLPIIDYRSPITDHRLSITDYRSPIIDHRSPITDYRSPITDHRLLTFPKGNRSATDAHR
ncbi:MAG: hypothetical protein AB1797_02180, partial [bacterium]